jgi:hypothetical protein
LIGFIILPGALPILIFSLFVRQIIRRLEKMKTSKMFGKIDITEEEIYKDLNWNGMRNYIKKKSKKYVE